MARLTPRYLATSLPVWPSAFILRRGDVLGVVYLAGRPNLVRLARDDARFSAVRSLMNSRSYSARDPRAPIIMRPQPLTSRCRLSRYQGHATLGERLHGFEDVQSLAAQPVKFPDDDSVTLRT